MTLTLTFRELENLLLADGWKLKNVRGSHYQYIHPIKHSKVTVPRHKGIIPKGTVNNILKQAELKDMLT